ncbi:hypothetical protein [Plasmodium yoelii yoelii]|uniref:Uncharacterized protein n=1 Tax=Plasmodium yoelii yoelii TaxID=73239 RepID=Q7RJF6_PLAYO|nr:hypothetical protein [Plasmodium yoelii yoelii]
MVFHIDINYLFLYYIHHVLLDVIPAYLATLLPFLSISLIIQSSKRKNIRETSPTHIDIFLKNKGKKLRVKN